MHISRRIAPPPTRVLGILLVCLVVGLADGTARAQVSDDFRTGNADSLLWQLVDPRGDGVLKGSPGVVHLELPGGPDHAFGTTANHALCLVQNLPDTDLALEVRFESAPNRLGQEQGLVLAQDDGTHVRLFHRHDGTGVRVAWARSVNHIVLERGEVAAAAGDTLSLRLVRSGATWTASHRTDGGAWQTAFVFDHGLRVGRGGVYAANFTPTSPDPDRRYDDPPLEKAAAGAAAPAFVATVDYVFDPSAPIVPEDPAARSFDGLAAFYMFENGSDPVVFDHAGTAAPLHLTALDTTAVRWLPGHGLRLESPTLVASTAPAQALTGALTASNALTLEAWLTPALTNQSGPARVVTLSADPSTRNLTLGHGQWGGLPPEVFGVRLRTSTRSLNGQPDFFTPVGALTGGRQHVVYTRAADGTAALYVDGQQVATETADGDLSTWDTGYRFALGGELDGTRNWLGDLHLVALYDRALDAGEVATHFAAGPDGGDLPPLAPAIISGGPAPGTVFTFSDTITVTAQAGDADGPLAAVEFRSGETVLFRDEAPPWAFAWSDPAVGGHQLSAVAIDADGLTATSTTIPVRVDAPAAFGAALALSDGFFDADLGAPWQLDDGTGGAVAAQSGGSVEIALPAASQDPWTGGALEFVAHQPETDTAVALDLMLDTDRWSGDGYAGLAIGDSLGTQVRLVAARTAGSWRLSWGAGGEQGAWDLGMHSGSLWIQLRREGAAFTALASGNGLVWDRLGSVSAALTVNRTGWFAGATAGAATIALDHAFNLAAPVVPEDGESGDFTGPVSGPIAITNGLDRLDLAWATDEVAFHRVRYGLTPALELGVVESGLFTTDHQASLTGLPQGARVHFEVVCLDIAGNVSVAAGLEDFTDAVAAAAPGPAAGDVYRETVLGFGLYSEDWRVTDPDAGHPDAPQFLPNPVLSVDVPDLAGAVRAELVIDRWGGHPGTTDKRIRLNGGSWLYVPESDAMPSYRPECYVYQDNPVIALPLDQLVSGAVTLEGDSGGQSCFNFDWGQWGWYGVVLRVYYDGSVAGPTGAILAPAAGGTITDTVLVDVDAAPGVDRVDVLARYAGADADGGGAVTGWQRRYRRAKSSNTLELSGHLGTLTTAPWDLTWDANWIPDQVPGSVGLQARLRGADGVWSVVEVDGLSLQHSGATVRAYQLEDLPQIFWVRLGEVKSATFTIPPGDDLGTASGARLSVSTWNGSAGGRISLNGTQVASSFGVPYHYGTDDLSFSTGELVSGENLLAVTSSSTGHGPEFLWPGPVVTVRYGAPAPAAAAVAGDVTGDGRADLRDARRVLEHLVGAAPLRDPLRADIDGDGLTGLDDAFLLAGLVPAKTATAAELAVGADPAAPGRARITLPGLAGVHAVELRLTGEDLTSRPGLFAGPDNADLLVAWHAAGDTLRAIVLGPFTADAVLGRITPGGPLTVQAAVDGAPLAPVTLGAGDLPTRFALVGNAPNPFNPTTRVAFDLPRAAAVRLRVHDVRGRLVATLLDDEMPAGRHHVTWDGRDDRGRRVASGAFFLRMESAGQSWTHKMLMLK